MWCWRAPATSSRSASKREGGRLVRSPLNFQWRFVGIGQVAGPYFCRGSGLVVALVDQFADRRRHSRPGGDRLRAREPATRTSDCNGHRNRSDRRRRAGSRRHAGQRLELADADADRKHDDDHDALARPKPESLDGSFLALQGKEFSLGPIVVRDSGMGVRVQDDLSRLRD